MVRRLHSSKEPNSDRPMQPKSKARMLGPVSSLMDLASSVSKKLKRKPALSNLSSKVAAPNKSPLRKPKQLMTSIGNKAAKLWHGKKIGEESASRRVEKEEEWEWGEGGVWQRSILMGDKCTPLDFSGAIYYDCKGNLLNEPPQRSPRPSLSYSVTSE